MGTNFLSKKVEKSVAIIPQSAIDLIKEFEGCHLHAYPDPLTKGPPITIGYGSTKDFNGTSFKLGRIITQEYAEKLLLFDLENRFLPSLSKIPYWNQMNDEMRGALLSFSYNLGAGFYGASGFNTISRVLRERKWNEIPEALKLYRNPGSSVEAGLLRRRIAEGDLFRRGLGKL